MRQRNCVRDLCRLVVGCFRTRCRGEPPYRLWTILRLLKCLLRAVLSVFRGDVLGARLMQAISARCADVRFAGIGGAEMQARGLASLFPMRDLALMGLLEVLPRLRHLRSRLRQAIGDIAARRPDVVVTIDSPSFTLRLLKAIQPLGVRLSKS